jgi:hypothetical protein
MWRWTPVKAAPALEQIGDATGGSIRSPLTKVNAALTLKGGANLTGFAGVGSYRYGDDLTQKRHSRQHVSWRRRSEITNVVRPGHHDASPGGLDSGWTNTRPNSFPPNQCRIWPRWSTLISILEVRAEDVEIISAFVIPKAGPEVNAAISCLAHIIQLQVKKRGFQRTTPKTAMSGILFTWRRPQCQPDS